MKRLRPLLFACSLLFAVTAHAEKVTVAAAADLKFAMDEIVASFKKANPTDAVEVIYGSSGKFSTQIQQGAPYDLYFSADIAFPRKLAKAGFAASEVKSFASRARALPSRNNDNQSVTTW